MARINRFQQLISGGKISSELEFPTEKLNFIDSMRNVLGIIDKNHGSLCDIRKIPVNELPEDMRIPTFAEMKSRSKKNGLNVFENFLIYKNSAGKSSKRNKTLIPTEIILNWLSWAYRLGGDTLYFGSRTETNFPIQFMYAICTVFNRGTEVWREGASASNSKSVQVSGYCTGDSTFQYEVNGEHFFFYSGIVWPNYINQIQLSFAVPGPVAEDPPNE
jgi:hypothetical protein